MIKSKSKIFHIIALVFFGAVLLMPETACAADIGIFNTISNKIISTLRDLRKIVYIIAGFGLIMFAVLAIFNKISFKHLMYICVSLFLLANMFNFINYFSGSGLNDNTSQQVWGDNLKTGENAAGSNVNEGKSCEGKDCPSPGDIKKVEGVTPPNIIGGGNRVAPPDTVSNTLEEAIKAKAQACEAAGNKWDEVKKKCKISTKNLIKGLKQAANTAKSVADTVHNAKKTIEAVVSAPGKIGDAISNIGKGEDLGDTFNNIANAASTIASVSGQIATGVSSTVSPAEIGMREASGLATTITGNENNSFSQRVANSSVVDALENVKQMVNDKHKDIHTNTSAVRDAADSGSSIVNSGKSIGRDVGL